MADAGITGVAVYLQPGMQLDITQPLNSIKNNGGFFALTDITTIESITELMPNPSKELLHGFLVEKGTEIIRPHAHRVGSPWQCYAIYRRLQVLSKGCASSNVVRLPVAFQMELKYLRHKFKNQDPN